MRPKSVRPNNDGNFTVDLVPSHERGVFLAKERATDSLGSAVVGDSLAIQGVNPNDAITFEFGDLTPLNSYLAPVEGDISQLEVVAGGALVCLSTEEGARKLNLVTGTTITEMAPATL